MNIDDSPETRSALFAALERTPAITNRIYAPGRPVAHRRRDAVDRDLPGREDARDRRRRTDGRILRCGAARVHRRRRRGIRNRTRDVQPGRADPRRRDVERRARVGRRRDPNRARPGPVRGLRRRDRVQPRRQRARHRRERCTDCGSSSSRATRSRSSRSAPKRLTPGDQVPLAIVATFPCSRWRSRRMADRSSRRRFYGPTVLWNAQASPGSTLRDRRRAGVAVSPDGAIAAIIENNDQHFEGGRLVPEPSNRTRCEQGRAGITGRSGRSTRPPGSPSLPTVDRSSRWGTIRGSWSGTSPLRRFARR